jgi:hypothetical protein
MSYYLSEAYSNLYNPRVDSFLNDNLRFLDFMQDHEIEEVVESLFWELRDYGNTLDESFEIMLLASSDEVITEAYDELFEEFLTESRSAVLARRAAAQQGLQQQKQILQGDMRKDARKARVDGAISRVKAAVSGAKGGMGRAAKALAKPVAAAAQSVSKTAQEGKARLGQLLRRGISKVQSGAGRVSRAYSAAKSELTGETGRQAALKNQMRQDIRSVRANQRTQRGKDTSAFTGTKPPVPPAPAAKSYPVEPSGQTSLFSGPVKGKSVGADVSVPPGGQRKYGSARRPKGGSGKRQLPLRFPKS